MKIIKYFFVGAAAAIVDVSLYSVFALFLEYNYLLVAMSSFVIATSVNYTLSIRYVFESGIRFAKNKEILIVFLLTSIGLIFNQIVLFVSVEELELDKFISKIIATGAVFFLNYLVRHFYIFRPMRTRTVD